LIQCKTINDILESYKITHIDYVSIDTEGAEFQIIENLNLNKFDIYVFSIENNKDTRVKKYLMKNGYTYIHGIQDSFFIKKRSLRSDLLSCYIFFLRIIGRLKLLYQIIINKSFR
jgi:hypothetical protein